MKPIVAKGVTYLFRFFRMEFNNIIIFTNSYISLTFSEMMPK